MHISLAAEYLFSLFGKLPVNNAILTTWLVMAVLLLLGLVLRRSLSAVPGRLQALFETIYDYFMETAANVIGRRDVAQAIFPFVITLFLFITLSNWTGLLPGNSSIGLVEQAHAAAAEGKVSLVSFLRPPTTDLNMVAAMALLAVGYVQYIGLRFKGGGYLKKFFDFSSPIMFFVGILELFSELTRTVSFTFRLFGNIFAGKVLVTVIFFLTLTLLPIFPILPIPFYILEMFVGVIQAFVFSFLVIVLSAVAVSGHGEEH